MHADQPAQDVDDTTRPDRSRDINRQALPGVFIDQRQAFQLLTVGAGIEYEGVAPYRIPDSRRMRPGPASRNPAPAPLAGTCRPVLLQTAASFNVAVSRFNFQPVSIDEFR